ncbi:hypothetical protein BK654_18520 [Pseudomonas brassicacearum]|uniref:hypothetical protein n=1 Tax=Pseudomonas brassicacearum TaxID=930166 RepID=UPI000F4AEA10|nr:hypothetical protein [Pseudomonas brassicacearum]ROM74848.1 hypothetical protein BK654_18520 [Pseudomonas brassicacearum]
MSTMSAEERLKAVKAAPRLEAKGSITITLNGQVTKTEDVYILDQPDHSIAGFIGEDKGIVIVQFSSLTAPGTYEIKKHNIWIHMSFHGFVGSAETGDLTLETIEIKNKYKGHFDVKTVDHQKVDGVFDVQKV